MFLKRHTGIILSNPYKRNQCIFKQAELNIDPEILIYAAKAAWAFPTLNRKLSFTSAVLGHRTDVSLFRLVNGCQFVSAITWPNLPFSWIWTSIAFVKIHIRIMQMQISVMHYIQFCELKLTGVFIPGK